MRETDGAIAPGADLWLGATARSEQLELIRGLGASFSFRSGFDGEQAVRASQGTSQGVKHLVLRKGSNI
jgi:hypothetical protein